MMLSFRRGGFGCLLLLALAGVDCGPRSRPAEPAAGPWLDRAAPGNWNLPGARIPRAPLNRQPDAAKCGETARPAKGNEEEQLAQAGWLIAGDTERHGATAIVSGHNDYDGMCRADQLNLFVFVEGKYAGTLAPAVMDARSDGSPDGPAVFTSPTGFSQAFARYTPDDALCCPSKQTVVKYRVETAGGSAVVVPAGSVTSNRNAR